MLDQATVGRGPAPRGVSFDRRGFGGAGFKELWRGMAGVSSHLRASKVGRDKSSRCKELCAAQGSDGVPDAKIQLTTGTTFRVTALIFSLLSWGYETGTFFDEEGSLL